MEHRMIAGFAPETKRAALSIAQVSGTGIFGGYASLFGVLDLGRDMIMKGAFEVSLKQRGPSQVKLLWQHDPAQPIGQWTSIVEDQRGLKVSGRLNLDVSRARDVFALMRDGSVDGLSIGFRTQRAREDKSSGLRQLLQVDLLEISIVTFPMLPQARILHVKGASRGEDQYRLARTITRAASCFR